MNSRRDDDITDPAAYDTAQRTLTGHRISRAETTRHRKAHHANHWTTPEEAE